jgi:hypothetical protein
VHTSITESELLFNQWCELANWQCNKIPEETEKTPDYEWFPNGEKIYAEIKEIIANEEEIKVLDNLKKTNFSGAYGEEPGKTVREKIKIAYPQLKSRAKIDNRPAVLVLYNNTGMAGFGRIDHYHVLIGMFGLQTVPFSLSADGGNWNPSGPDFFGPKKSVTENRNRYLSGILTLYRHHERGLLGFMHHNPFAKFPIKHELINVTSCIQYVVSTTEINWDLIKL